MVAVAAAKSEEVLGDHAGEVVSVPEPAQSPQQNSSAGRTERRPAVMDIKPPSPMQFSGNLTDNWKRFKQRFEIYLTASGAGQGDVKLQAQIFL